MRYDLHFLVPKWNDGIIEIFTLEHKLEVVLIES